MKLPAIIVGAALALVSTFSIAQADEINFSGSSVDMGHVDYGQYGTITNIYETLFSLPPHQAGSGQAFGFLPNNAAITFTYSFTGLREGSLTGYGAYDHDIGGDNYSGSALATSGGFNYSEATVNGVASTPLVFATANLNVGDPSSGTIRITNISGAFASFQALFYGILTQVPNAVGSINYVVSSVPLPAALPIFASLLAGLFGFGHARRKKMLAA